MNLPMPETTQQSLALEMQNMAAIVAAIRSPTTPNPRPDSNLNALVLSAERLLRIAGQDVHVYA